VNNAGIGAFENFDDYRDEVWRKVIEVNQNVCYFLGRRAALQMKKQGGGKNHQHRFGSLLHGGQVMSALCVSKHAVMGLTRCFANELGAFNIQTNAIAPGFIKTEVNAAISGNRSFTTRSRTAYRQAGGAKPTISWDLPSFCVERLRLYQRIGWSRGRRLHHNAVNFLEVARYV
jgi:NAD(P)-dependent dehydrogenase (short-subunit alcohol dehydrogenase family)